MWPHFINLLHRAWTSLLASLGTTTLAFVVYTFIIPICIFAVTLWNAWKREEPLWSHFRKTFQPTLMSILVAVVVVALLFGRKIITTVYEDHLSLVQSNGSLSRKNAELEVDNKKIAELEADNKKIEPLQREIAAQKQQIDQLAKPKGRSSAESDGPPDVIMHINPTEPNLKIATNARQVLMLTDKTIPSPHLKLTCNGDLVKSDVWISGAGLVAGGSEVVNKRIVYVSIDSPAWTPKAPLLVTLFYNDPNQITDCTMPMPR